MYLEQKRWGQEGDLDEPTHASDELQAKTSSSMAVGGKGAPMLTCSCSVVADPAIRAQGPIIPSSCRIYPPPLPHNKKGIFQVKSRKETLVISACRRSVIVCVRFDLDSMPLFTS
jgi:hypothetical protein